MLSLPRIVIFLCLLLFGWMALGDSSRVGVTADETAHLTAGYSYWLTNDYRLQPENGNLPQRWAALPSLLNHAVFPSLDSSAWDQADVWFYGRQFFFHSGHQTEDLLFSGRAMIILFGLALVALCFHWSRQLFGFSGAVVTGGLIIFCPHLLAHSALITSDLTATLGFLLALGCWWLLCHRLTPVRILATGLATGFLALSKFSAALFVPIALLVLLVRCLRSIPLAWKIGQNHGRLHTFGGKLGALVSCGLLAALLAVFMIWGAYGFRYSAHGGPESHFAKPWSEVLIETPSTTGSTMADGLPPTDPVHLEPGIVQHFVSFARHYQLLPEAYLYGLAFTDLHARGRLAYFAGDYRETGWWDFFPVAFVLKTTLPALFLLILSLIFLTQKTPKSRKRLLYRLSPLLIFLGVYWVFALTSHLNIGHRHLLPLYPALFIGAGILGSAFRKSGKSAAAIIVVILLLWHAGESLRSRPHYLTYFNQLAGGPEGGHRYFVDSSLDWGQGLPDLKTWLEQYHHDEPLYLSYFGSDDPRRFGLNAIRIGDLYFDHSHRQILPELRAGTYCISATMLHRVYTQVRGPWSTAYENAYHQLAQLITTEKATTEQLQTFAQLRFGRLCHYLTNRSPDDTVSHTFFIFQLSEEELTQALLAPWN